MSAINGDKARFHRRRKAAIARRARNRERLQALSVQRKAEKATSGSERNGVAG